MQILHLFLCISLSVCSFFVAFSTSPIKSVLFLILTFCNAGAILFVFNTEFLGLIYIIIYVGAIAVLFLFVIMMLNIKLQEKSTDFVLFIKKNLLSIMMFVGLFIISFVLFFTEKLKEKNLSLNDTLWLENNSEPQLLTDNLNNIDLLGQVLYNYFLICFLLAGIVLLISLVGSIILTLRFNNLQKSQLVNRQLARTDNFLSFFK